MQKSQATSDRVVELGACDLFGSTSRQPMYLTLYRYFQEPCR